MSRLCSLMLLVVRFVNADHPVLNSGNSEFGRSFSKNCDSSYTFTCLKLDIVSWVDKLNEQEDFSVLPGLSIVRENVSVPNTADIVANLAREFPEDPDARLDEFLTRKVTSFAQNHAIKLKLNWNEEANGARKVGGGGGGGKGGGLLGLLAMAGLMKGTLLAIAMAGLAALAGKALMLAMMSLLMSALAAMKGHGGGGKTTYEVIAKPVHTHSASHSESHEGYHGHSGYGRSFDQPLPKVLESEYKPLY